MVQALDCNDNNNTVYQGATEIPGDSIDQDCDGLDDCYYDADNDGQGGINAVIITGTDINCSGTNESSNNWDCDETRPTVYFGSPASEVPGDGIDQDCDGLDFCFLRRFLDQCIDCGHIQIACLFFGNSTIHCIKLVREVFQFQISDGFGVGIGKRMAEVHERKLET